VTPSAVNVIAVEVVAEATTAKTVAPAATRASAKPSAITTEASCTHQLM